VRHPGWMLFRIELLHFAFQHDGKLYQPVTHPDLDDIPAAHDCEERFRLIKEHMSATGGRLLDIGANFGYFCHGFEGEGFDCYAVESSAEALHVLKKIKRAENRRFTVLAGSALECPELLQTQFEVMLALNIFHHFLKTKDLYDKFVGLLEGLQTRELFFEPHLPEERQMRDAYRNYPPEEFVDFLLRHSGLTKAETLGLTKSGRPLYRLS
jgi:Methyltransferase domain